MSLKKIAEMTGVSISTVSRVLNNREYNCASEELKDKIWAAAREIKYIPDESARALKLGRIGRQETPTWNLSVILERFHSLDEDPFFRELFRSVEQEIFASGCTISEICFSGADSSHPHLPRADGYVLLGRSTEQSLHLLKKSTKNIVSVSRNPTQYEIDEIICDGRAAASAAMDYLIRKGYRRIAYIGDCSHEERYVGYCDTMIRNHLPMDYTSIFPSDQTIEGGCSAIKKLLLSDTPEAIFCANDATALGVLKGWHACMETEKEKNIKKMPALISIDDIRAAAEVTPSLTTVHIPCEEMGKAAVKVLLDRIRRGHTEKVRVEFPSRLVIRESC